MRKQKKPHGEPFPAKCRKLLVEMYTENGVGKSAKQRHAFWNKQNPNTYISHVDPSDDVMRVKSFEFLWLTLEHPTKL